MKKTIKHIGKVLSPRTQERNTSEEISTSLPEEREAGFESFLNPTVPLIITSFPTPHPRANREVTSDSSHEENLLLASSPRLSGENTRSPRSPRTPLFGLFATNKSRSRTYSEPIKPDRKVDLRPSSDKIELSLSEQERDELCAFLFDEPFKRSEFGTHNRANSMQKASLSFKDQTFIDKIFLYAIQHRNLEYFVCCLMIYEMKYQLSDEEKEQLKIYQQFYIPNVQELLDKDPAFSEKLAKLDNMANFCAKTFFAPQAKFEINLGSENEMLSTKTTAEIRSTWLQEHDSKTSKFHELLDDTQILLKAFLTNYFPIKRDTRISEIPKLSATEKRAYIELLADIKAQGFEFIEKYQLDNQNDALKVAESHHRHQRKYS